MPIGAYHMMGGIMATFGQNAGVLKLNGTTLKFDASTPAQQNRYTDTLSSRNYSAGASWDLAANSSFGSFTTTVTRGYPVISNVNYLPASVSKASGFTLTMGPGNYSNTDSLIVFVSGVGGVSPFKHLPGNATSVSFSPLDLSTLGTGSGLLIVFGINYSNMMVSGKNYVFIMQHDLSNPVQINP